MTTRPTDDSDRIAEPTEDPLFGELSSAPDADGHQSPIFGELWGTHTRAPEDQQELDVDSGPIVPEPPAAEPTEEAPVEPVVAEEPEPPSAESPQDVAPAPRVAAPPPVHPTAARPLPPRSDEATVPRMPTGALPKAPGPKSAGPKSPGPKSPGPASTVPEPPAEPQPDPEPPHPVDPEPRPVPEPGRPLLPEPLPRPGPPLAAPSSRANPLFTPGPAPRYRTPPPDTESTVQVPPVTRPGPRVGTTAHEPAEWLSAERTVALPLLKDDQPTQVIRPGPPSGPQRYPGPPSGPQRHPVPPGPPTPPSGGPTATGGRPPWTPRKALTTVIGAVLGLFAMLYIVDVVTSSGEVPRGVTVAGVDIGGRSHSAAEDTLREEIEPRLGNPVALEAGETRLSLDPAAAGLQLDWAGTVDAAGDQSLNPLTRLASIFTHEEKDTVTIADRGQVARTLESLRPQIDRAPVEGTIRFEGLTPVAVTPVSGQRLDVETAVDRVLDDWADGEPVELPVDITPVRTTPEGVAAAVGAIARPAVSGPLTVTGEGVQGVLQPRDIAAALRFAPNGDGGLTATLDVAAVQQAIGPAMGPSEQPSRDATFLIQNGAPVLQPSTDGRTVDWIKTLEPALGVLTGQGSRSLPAVYAHQPAKLTTEQAAGLGIRELVGEFTTGGFAGDSGRNIKRAAEQVNGTIVKPGDTFSLNGHTGPRTAAAGYVNAGIIEAGRPTRGIGGGVSQFATTLYNASYFAGMVDVEHKEHSFYISRYPLAREATVYEGAIDLRFKNDKPTGILITTSWTPSNVTVQLWGTKHVDVESITGPRTNFTPPPVFTPAPGEPCSPTNGTQGFTATDTRVIRDAVTKQEIDRKTRTVRYTGQQKTVCPTPPVDRNAPPGNTLPTFPTPPPG